MKITVANKDRRSDLGRELEAAATARADHVADRLLVREISALRLREASTESEFLTQYIEHLRIRHGLHVQPSLVPGKPGLLSGILRWVKARLGSLLRYQHDHTAFQQGLMNELLVEALEFQQEQFRCEIQSLRARLDRVEDRAAGRKG